MRFILWLIGLVVLLGGVASSGCEGGYVRERPYYYYDGDPYFDLYYGEAEPYYFDEHRWGKRHEWVEDRGGHEDAEHLGGGEFHEGGSQGGQGR